MKGWLVWTSGFCKSMPFPLVSHCFPFFGSSPFSNPPSSPSSPSSSSSSSRTSTDFSPSHQKHRSPPSPPEIRDFSLIPGAPDVYIYIYIFLPSRSQDLEKLSCHAFRASIGMKGLLLYGMPAWPATCRLSRKSPTREGTKTLVGLKGLSKGACRTYLLRVVVIVLFIKPLGGVVEGLDIDYHIIY